MKRHLTCFQEKAWFEPMTLGAKAERYDHCATRPVLSGGTVTAEISSWWWQNDGRPSAFQFRNEHRCEWWIRNFQLCCVLPILQVKCNADCVPEFLVNFIDFGFIWRLKFIKHCIPVKSTSRLIIQCIMPCLYLSCCNILFVINYIFHISYSEMKNFPALNLSYHVLGIFLSYSKNIHNLTICECFVKRQAAKMTGLWLAKPRHGALGWCRPFQRQRPGDNCADWWVAVGHWQRDSSVPFVYWCLAQ